MRFFIDAAASMFFPPYVVFFNRDESPDNSIAGVAEVQELLPLSGFAVGDGFTIADAALAPFLSRADLFLRNDVGTLGKYMRREWDHVCTHHFRE